MAGDGNAGGALCYISDLGKGLGPVALTRDGSYLAAMNPFDIPVERKELCKLAILVERNELPVKHLSPAIKHVIK